MTVFLKPKQRKRRKPTKPRTNEGREGRERKRRERREGQRGSNQVLSNSKAKARSKAGAVSGDGELFCKLVKAK